MPERRPPLDLSRTSLDALAAAVGDSSLPPVDRWNPTHCGDSEMRIARDGRWFHQGSPIARPEMVRLFSTILRREPDGSHVLVTPVEKLSIEVDVCPLVATAMKMEGEGRERRIALSLNRGDAVFVDADHPLRVVELPDGPSPRVGLDHGIEAELARSLYYDLADAALAEGCDPPGLWSCGTFFPLVP